MASRDKIKGSRPYPYESRPMYCDARLAELYVTTVWDSENGYYVQVRTVVGWLLVATRGKLVLSVPRESRWLPLIVHPHEVFSVDTLDDDPDLLQLVVYPTRMNTEDQVPVVWNLFVKWNENLGATAKKVTKRLNRLVGVRNGTHFGEDVNPEPPSEDLLERVRNTPTPDVWIDEGIMCTAAYRTRLPAAV